MKKNARVKILFFILVITLIGTLTIRNVIGLETFSGYVKDRLGNPISGATVILTDSQEEILGFTTTNANGYYSLSASLSGYSPYYLIVGKTGYQGSNCIVTGGGQYNFNLYAFIFGYARNSLNQPIANLPVKLYINDILTDTDYTQSNGYYSFLLNSYPTNGLIKTEKFGYRDISLSLTGGSQYNLNLKALWAIIVGISDYQYLDDFEYCDEDATDWYNKLYAMGYKCRIYGDNNDENYPRYDDLATEANVREAIQDLSDITGSGDTVCFITSGHGGRSVFQEYLCMYECLGSAGCYKETEIEDDFEDFASGVNLFFFFDNCHSGGIISSLNDMPNKDYIYVAACCQWNGECHEYPAAENGYWTFYFLYDSWETEFEGDSSISMQSIFEYADYRYPYTGADNPKEYYESGSFYL